MLLPENPINLNTQRQYECCKLYTSLISREFSYYVIKSHRKELILSNAKQIHNRSLALIRLYVAKLMNEIKEQYTLDVWYNILSMLVGGKENINLQLMELAWKSESNS